VITMVHASPGIRRKTGRPLSFNREEALHKALLLFWRHGYEATSVNDLTEEMGITPPSLYACYGNKKQLFLEAVHLYLGPNKAESIIDGAPTAKAAAESLLEASAIAFTGTDTPRGCLLASAAASCSAEAADVQAELGKMRKRIEGSLRRRIAKAVKSGELDHDADPVALAGFTMSVIQGMSILARDGASREKLLTIAAASLRAWPGSPASV
jgi:AcrR family transcriptional regulator